MRLHGLADAHLIANDPDGAIAALLEATALCPERCPGQLRALVALYEKAGLTREAVAWLEQQVAAHPSNRVALEELARARRRGESQIRLTM